MDFTPDELDALKAIVCDWVGEGFTTPPYAAVLYALFEKLGVTQADVPRYYDITPPDDVLATKVAW